MKTPSYHKINLDLPAYWTPEQALAVFDLLDDLRDKIWAHYGHQLQQLIPQLLQSPSSNHQDDSQTELPF